MLSGLLSMQVKAASKTALANYQDSHSQSQCKSLQFNPFKPSFNQQMHPFSLQ